MIMAQDPAKADQVPESRWEVCRCGIQQHLVVAVWYASRDSRSQSRAYSNVPSSTTSITITE
jgi:hypothetical protein